MGALTGTEIAEMMAADVRRRAQRDDDDLRLRGIVTEARKFNPMQKRDPDGTWGDGIPGPSALKDALNLAGRIELEDGERLAGSGRLNLDSPNGMEVVWAVVDHPGGREYRIGTIPEGDVGKWRAAEKGATAPIPAESAQRLIDDLAAAQSKAVDLADEAEAIYSAGDTPSDPVLNGGAPVAEGTVDSEWGPIDWSVYLDDSEPTSYVTSFKVGANNGLDAVELDADGLTKLIDGLDNVVSADASASSERTSAERQFTEALHPRVPSGATAGEFTKGGQKPAAKKTAAKKSTDPPPKTEVGSGKSGKARGPRVRIPKGALGYDPASNHGTGYGVKGGDKRVHTLQQALNRLGFTDMHGKKLRDDGELGPLTTAAVKKAQLALGVKADGIVTPQLLKRIEAMKPTRRRTATAKSATTTKRRSAAMELCTRAFDFEFDSDVRDGRTLEGYAAVFDSPARIRDLQGDFDETIRPGAFKRSLAVRTPVLQFDHGKDPRIGGTPIGKIDALSEDSRGLHVRARLFTHPDVERVREAIAEGAVNGMSFRFGVPDKGDVWGRNADGVDTREIRDADIHELGPVVFPAYDQTSVSVRSLLSQLGPEETRELLHELAGHLGLAVDLQDLTGRPSARSAGGGDIGTSPGVGRVPATPSTRQLLDDGTLRLKGIIK